MSKKLLLADDSVTIQKVVELVLADEDFEIRTASDGEEAMKIIKEFMPHIVLADIEMPKMNGYQLCERLKNDETTKDIPVVLLAGAFEPIDEELFQDVKADDYLIKPFESEELISKINALIAERELPPSEPQQVGDTTEEAIAEGVVAEEISSEEPLEVAEAVEVAEPEAIEEVAELGEAEAVEEAVEIAEHAETVEEVAETIEEATSEEDREAEEMAEEIGEELSFAEELGAEEAEPVAEEIIEAPEEVKQDAEPVVAAAEEMPAFEEKVEPLEESTTSEETASSEDTEQVSTSLEISLPSKQEVMGAIERKINEQLGQLIGSIHIDDNEVKAGIERAISEKVANMTAEIRVDDIKETIVNSVDEKVAESVSQLVQGIDIKGALDEKIDLILRDDLKRMVEEIAPEIIESSVKKAIEEISESLKKKIENVIWETVPDLA